MSKFDWQEFYDTGGGHSSEGVGVSVFICFILAVIVTFLWKVFV